MNTTKSPIQSVTSHGLAAIRSRAGDHLNQIVSNRSEIRVINQDEAVDEGDLLAQIGYKQELNRSYNSLQVFGIAFSIMGLLPSIASTLATGLEAGPVGLTWGWLISGLFILCIGTLMSILSSLIPTSGGLYYWTNYYAPDLIRTPLSFMIGCSNSLALCGGICLINYGFATELLSAIYINRDGNFDITNARIYGVFAACVVSHVIVCCATTKHTASLQTFSICINVFIIILFFIAVPVGVSKNYEFNSAKFIFTEIDNFRTWDQGWSFMLSWMPAIWTIGAYDSCLHLSEEALNPRKSVPIGILSSIFVCWIVGWVICIVACVAIKDGDVGSVLESSTGLAMAQIIYDALGKSWAVAFMSLIAFAQYLMGASILIAASRQVWAFARDDGLPFFHNFVKVINPKIKVPVRATIFSGCLSLILGLLILIDSTAANALFSLAVAGNYLAWGMPVLLVLLPVGRSRFTPGPFYLGKFWTEVIHITTVSWIGYVIIMCMFPDNKAVSSETMNYTCVINAGIWFLSLVYYFVYGYKKFSGPKSNLDEDRDSAEITVIQNVDEVLSKKA